MSPFARDMNCTAAVAWHYGTQKVAEEKDRTRQYSRDSILQAQSGPRSRVSHILPTYYSAFFGTSERSLFELAALCTLMMLGAKALGTRVLRLFGDSFRGSQFPLKLRSPRGGTVLSSATCTSLSFRRSILRRSPLVHNVTWGVHAGMSRPYRMSARRNEHFERKTHSARVQRFRGSFSKTPSHELYQVEKWKYHPSTSEGLERTDADEPSAPPGMWFHEGR